MTVAVVPGFFMAIFYTWGHQLIQNVGQVLLQARLKFDRAQSGGAANIEQVDNPLLCPGLIDDFGDLIGQVVHIAVARGLDGDFLLVYHQASCLTRAIHSHSDAA